MSLSAEEQAYLSRIPMKRLTFIGVDDLYLHPFYGSYTIKECIRIEQIRKSYKPSSFLPFKEIEISEEMSIRNEKCIDEHGCSSFLY